MPSKLVANFSFHSLTPLPFLYFPITSSPLLLFFPLGDFGTHPKKLSECHLIEHKRLIDIFHVRKDYRRYFLSEFLCKSRSNSDIKVDKSIIKLSFVPFAKDVIFFGKRHKWKFKEHYKKTVFPFHVDCQKAWTHLPFCSMYVGHHCFRKTWGHVLTLYVLGSRWGQGTWIFTKYLSEANAKFQNHWYNATWYCILIFLSDSLCPYHCISFLCHPILLCIEYCCILCILVNHLRSFLIQELDW